MNKIKSLTLCLVFSFIITITLIPVFGQEIDSPYLAYVQIQIRDSSGALVGTIDTDTILYRTTSATDELLNSYPVLVITKKDGIKYEKREITATITSKEDIALPRTDLFSSKTSDIIVFSALHHAYVLDKGYTYTIKWTIYRPIFE